jgi:hypothetical protein
VRSLEGKWINGYGSFDSVAMDADKKQIHLLACQVGKLDTDLNQAGLEQIVGLHKGLKEANPMWCSAMCWIGGLMMWIIFRPWMLCLTAGL